MLSFLLLRISRTIIVIIIITMIVFGLLHVSGDPVAMLLPQDAPLSEIAKVQEKMGLNEALYVQYYKFLESMFTGKLTSYRLKVAIFPFALTRFFNTLKLILIALFIAFTIAVPLGIFASSHRGQVSDFLALALALLGQSIPTFWLGMLFMQVFSVHFDVLPVSGKSSFLHWILPVATLATHNLGILVRMIRSSMLEVLNQDYVSVARAKGLRESRVLGLHALRNALIGVLSLMGTRLAAMMGGVILLEIVFSWPGIGRLIFSAVSHRDYPVVLVCAIILATAVGVTNLLIDFSYAYLDPRIRVEGG